MTEKTTPTCRWPNDCLYDERPPYTSTIAGRRNVCGKCGSVSDRTETTLPKPWKGEYLRLADAITGFLAAELASPHNRVTAMLAKKLEASRVLLGMEVNGYDGGMERDLLDRIAELDSESYEAIQLYPETPDDR